MPRRRRSGGRPSDAPDATPNQVVTIAAAADAPTASEIREGLGALGIAVAPDRDVVVAGARAVVVMSAAGLSDPDWLARLEAVERIDDVRLIPIARGKLDADDVPVNLRPLSWVPWDGDTAKSTAQLFGAIHSDPAVYKLHRSLSAEAQQWHDSDSDRDLLIGDRRRAAAAVEHLDRSRTDALARPTPMLEAFIAASADGAKLARRRRRNRWLRRAIGIGLVGGTLLTLVVTFREVSKSNQLTVAIDPTLNPDHPERAAQLAAALLIQGRAGEQRFARLAFVDALTQPWGEGLLGSNFDASLSDAVVVPKLNLVESVDFAGTFTTWRRSSGFPLDRHRLTRRALDLVDISDDGQTAVAAGDSALWIIRPLPWHSRRIAAGAPVTALAVSATGRRVAIATDHELIAYDSATARVTHRMPLSGILDLRAVAGDGLGALIRRGAGRALAIVDPITGTTRSERSLPAWAFERGSLSPDGRGAVITASDRQMHYAAHGLRFRPTGIAVTESTDALELLQGGAVAFANPEFGTRLADLTSGLIFGQTCRTRPTVSRIRAVPGEPAILCSDARLATVWPTDEIATVRAPASEVSRRRRTTDRNRTVDVHPGARGRIEVEVRNGAGVARFAIAPHGAPWTVAALRGELPHVFIGDARGRVFGYDLVGGHAQLESVWSSPDGTVVREIGVDPADRAQRFFVQTASGRWWRPRSCVGCSVDAIKLGIVHDGIQMCAPDEAYKLFTAASRAALGLVCPPAPEPKEG
jgi:hypothetical protein